MLRVIYALVYFAVLTGYANGGPKPKAHPQPPCPFTEHWCEVVRRPNIRVEFDAPKDICTKMNPHGDPRSRFWFERSRCTADLLKADWPGSGRCATEERA